MCVKNPDYDPEIYMVEHYAGPLVDCYFTNGDVRRYDITPAVNRGGVYAPLADENVVKRSLTVYKGTLAFDLAGDVNPFDILDFCPDTVYEKSESILPVADKLPPESRHPLSPLNTKLFNLHSAKRAAPKL